MKGQRFQRARARTMARARHALNTRAILPQDRAAYPQTARDCVVLHTEVIAGKPGEPIAYYSLSFERSDGRPPFFVCTRNETIYKRAAAAEGWAYVRFNVSWHAVERADGVWINQLDALEEFQP